MRSNSAYSYNHQSTQAPSMFSANSSDDDSDEDAVFEPTTPLETSADDARSTPETLIPCEFCQLQQPSENLLHHEVQRFDYFSVIIFVSRENLVDFSR
ncbi:unnamed protein product [Rotaria sp. Silwood2]|nr:unnamed protein product [Rotaria sp. Silwood2]